MLNCRELSFQDAPWFLRLRRSQEVQVFLIFWHLPRIPLDVSISASAWTLVPSIMTSSGV